MTIFRPSRLALALLLSCSLGLCSCTKQEIVKIQQPKKEPSTAQKFKIHTELMPQESPEFSRQIKETDTGITVEIQINYRNKTCAVQTFSTLGKLDEFKIYSDSSKKHLAESRKYNSAGKVALTEVFNNDSLVERRERAPDGTLKINSFNPDGKSTQIAVLNPDGSGKVQIFNPAKPDSLVRELTLNTGNSLKMQFFTPGGRLIREVDRQDDGNAHVRLYDLNGKVQMSLNYKVDGPAKIRPYTSGWNLVTVEVFNTSTGKLARKLTVGGQEYRYSVTAAEVYLDNGDRVDLNVEDDGTVQDYKVTGSDGKVTHEKAEDAKPEWVDLPLEAHQPPNGVGSAENYRQVIRSRFEN